MPNSADKSINLNGSLDEDDSDVIELTDELDFGTPSPTEPEILEALAFDIPEFRLPSTSSGAGDDSQVDSPTERLEVPTLSDDSDAMQLDATQPMKLPREAVEFIKATSQESPKTGVDLSFGAEPLNADLPVAVGPSPPKDSSHDGAPDGFDRQEMVKTIQMSAVSRSELELALSLETLGRAQPLGDQRYAPDVLIYSPRVLIKRWQEGPPLMGPNGVASESAALPVSSSDALELDSEVLLDEDEGNLPAAPPPRPPALGSGGPPKLTLPKRPPPQQQAAPGRPEPSAPDEQEVDGLVKELLSERRGAAAKPQPPKPEGPRETWFKQIFNDEYYRTLPDKFDQQTRRESRFIENQLSLEKGARILDLACGFGRHSLELAPRGYEMAGLDLSMPFLQRALNDATQRNLKIKFIHGDMRKLNFENIFDGAFIWDSFGFFDDATNLRVLQDIYRALKSGGRFLLQAVNRDHIVSQMPTRCWWEGQDCVFLEEVEFDFTESVLHTKRSYIYEDGSPPLEQNSYIRLYAQHELLQFVHHAGFEVIETSGELYHPSFFLGPASSNLIMLCEKPIG